MLFWASCTLSWYLRNQSSGASRRISRVITRSVCMLNTSVQAWSTGKLNKHFSKWDLVVNCQEKQNLKSRWEDKIFITSFSVSSCINSSVKGFVMWIKWLLFRLRTNVSHELRFTMTPSLWSVYLVFPSYLHHEIIATSHSWIYTLTKRRWELFRYWGSRFLVVLEFYKWWILSTSTLTWIHIWEYTEVCLRSFRRWASRFIYGLEVDHQICPWEIFVTLCFFSKCLRHSTRHMWDPRSSNYFSMKVS